MIWLRRPILTAAAFSLALSVSVSSAWSEESSETIASLQLAEEWVAECSEGWLLDYATEGEAIETGQNIGRCIGYLTGFMNYFTAPKRHEYEIHHGPYICPPFLNYDMTSSLVYPNHLLPREFFDEYVPNNINSRIPTSDFLSNFLFSYYSYNDLYSYTFQVNSEYYFENCRWLAMNESSREFYDSGTLSGKLFISGLKSFCMTFPLGWIDALNLHYSDPSMKEFTPQEEEGSIFLQLCNVGMISLDEFSANTIRMIVGIHTVDYNRIIPMSYVNYKTLQHMNLC